MMYQLRRAVPLSALPLLFSFPLLFAMLLSGKLIAFTVNSIDEASLREHEKTCSDPESRGYLLLTADRETIISSDETSS